jgi:hypothetical protein
VLKAFQGLEYEDATMMDAYERLLENLKISGLDIESHDSQKIIRGMFAVICWTSATLKPILHTETLCTTTNAVNSRLGQNILLEAENSSQIYSYSNLRRPISKIFHHFQPHYADVKEVEDPLGDLRNQSGGGMSNDVLYESSLNYFSLSTIGRVRITWVDTLTSHLAFDRSTRTLSIFRFPSFCATNVLGKPNIKVLQK